MTAPLRFATFLAPNMAPVYRYLADRISRRLGRPVELVVGRSFDQFERGQADLGVICGLPHVWLAARHPAPVEPLAAPVLSGGPVRWPSRLLLRCDRRPRQPDHPPGGAGGPLLGLQRAGVAFRPHRDPLQPGRHGGRPGFLGKVLQAGFHQRAIRLVQAGTVDAAAIDSQVLAIELRDHPRLAGGMPSEPVGTGVGQARAREGQHGPPQ